jgi:outer membrane lipoprotein-sorting protein
MEMHFSRLLLIVAAALPLGACMTAAEQAQEIAANADAACRSAGQKPGTPAYAKCREDRTRQASQQMFSALNQANQLQMQQQQTMMMMRH